MRANEGQCDPPTAMKDREGNILTTEEEIKAEAIKHYKSVFEDKEIDSDYKTHKDERENLCSERIKQAANNKTPPWTIDDVKNAIKNLNNGISKDPNGHPNEIYKKGVGGQGLIKAVTKVMNKLKDNPQEYPAAMEVCNITSIYKNKGDRNLFDSHRGVFRTTTLRNIMDRLIYNDEYTNIDSNLTDYNVGSRK